ncbi:MAG: DUF4116 domain-containing protein [Clostridia bacterium]|nr:DUF4116 domain-containing protein [Clostridia bacterium]
MENFSVRKLLNLVENYPTDESLQNDREITLAVAKRNPSVLPYANPSFLSDKEIAIETVRADGRALRFFSKQIKEDEDVVLLAVQNFCSSFSFAEGSARVSEKVAKAVAKRGGETIELLDERFLDDENIALIAIERNPKALKYFSERVRGAEKVVLTALSRDRTTIEFVSDDAFSSKKVFEKAVGTSYDGKIRISNLSNDSPQGVFDEIERRELSFNLAMQKLDLLTIDIQKLKICLKLGVGAINKKNELFKRCILSDNPQLVALIVERGNFSSKVISDGVKFASQNRKVRVLPVLLKLTGGVGEMAENGKNDRMYLMRSLRRKSPTATARFKENFKDYLLDREVMMLAAWADGTIIKLMQNTEYLSDEDFVTECLKSYIVKKSDGAILDGLNLSLNYGQSEIACQKDGRNYFYLKDEYKNDPHFAMLAVRSCEAVYDLLPDEFKGLEEIKREKRLWIR